MEESEDEDVVVFVVPEGVTRERADKVLAMHFTDFSRAQIQRTLEVGGVRKKGEVIGKNTSVSEGDVLEVSFLQHKPTKLIGVDIPLDILYEDEDILVINKGAGMVVHPGSGTGEDTLVHALLHHTNGNLSLAGGEGRPGVVHRLDKETTGVILFAKTDKAYFELIRMFSGREVDKQYVALVSGVPSLKSGTIKEAIGRHPVNRTRMAVIRQGRPAHTNWVLEESFERCALLRCYLLTGRTHQLRVHLSHIKHPILGDKAYGYTFKKDHIKEPPRVMLHAERIAFNHPITGKPMVFKAPIPEDFKAQLRLLRGE